MKNKSIQIILAILFSCLGLYIAFRGIEWTNFFTEIRSVSLPWYIGGMFGMLLVLFIRGLKWKLLLKPLGEYKVMNLYKGTTAGFFTNYVLPFRMGEIARAYITGNIIGQRGAVIFPSIVVERFIDSLAFFLFVILFSLFTDLPLAARQIKIIRIAMILMLIIFIAVFLIYRHLKDNLTEKLKNRHGKFWKIIKDLHHGFLALFEVDKVFLVFLGSLAVWLVTGWTYYAGVKACNLELGVTESYILFVTAMVAISIPAAPGYVGTFHAAMVAALAIFGVEKNAAQSYAVLQHLIGMIPICIFGFIYFLESNIKLKDISRLKEVSEHDLSS